MNYIKVREFEKKTYKELIDIEKNKNGNQQEKFKKYIFLKKLKEELINEQQSKEPFKFNYK